MQRRTARRIGLGCELSARILLGGIIDFVLVLAVAAIATMIVLGESPVEAFYAATKTIITVGPNHLVDEARRGSRASRPR